MYFFDMDGVLIDSNGIWKKVDRDFLSRRGLRYTHAYYEGVAHVPLPQAAVFTREFCGLSESCEEIIAEWMALAGGAYAKVNVKPGVRAYLKQCKADGQRMAVVTSSVPEHCHTALETLGLDKYFERVTFAQELGLTKRGPDIWLAAAKAAGVPPEDCMVFDDSLAACQGAKAAGMRAAGVYDSFFHKNEQEMRAYCDLYVTDFRELLREPERQAEP